MTPKETISLLLAQLASKVIEDPQTFDTENDGDEYRLAWTPALRNNGEVIADQSPRTVFIEVNKKKHIFVVKIYNGESLENFYQRRYEEGVNGNSLEPVKISYQEKHWLYNSLGSNYRAFMKLWRTAVNLEGNSAPLSHIQALDKCFPGLFDNHLLGSGNDKK